MAGAFCEDKLADAAEVDTLHRFEARAGHVHIRASAPRGFLHMDRPRVRALSSENQEGCGEGFRAGLPDGSHRMASDSVRELPFRACAAPAAVCERLLLAR